MHPMTRGMDRARSESWPLPYGLTALAPKAVLDESANRIYNANNARWNLFSAS